MPLHCVDHPLTQQLFHAIKEYRKNDGTLLPNHKKTIKRWLIVRKHNGTFTFTVESHRPTAIASMRQPNTAVVPLRVEIVGVPHDFSVRRVTDTNAL